LKKSLSSENNFTGTFGSPKKKRAGSPQKQFKFKGSVDIREEDEL
jgi:hypothetical protein